MAAAAFTSGRLPPLADGAGLALDTLEAVGGEHSELAFAILGKICKMTSQQRVCICILIGDEYKYEYF